MMTYTMAGDVQANVQHEWAGRSSEKRGLCQLLLIARSALGLFAGCAKQVSIGNSNDMRNEHTWLMGPPIDLLTPDGAITDLTTPEVRRRIVNQGRTVHTSWHPLQRL